MSNKINILDKEKLNKAYLFLSLILKKRTIDLCFNDELKAKRWFYGIYCFCYKTLRNYKINSCTNYILNRIKCKIFNELQYKPYKIDNITFSHCICKYFSKKKDKNIKQYENSEYIEDKKNYNDINNEENLNQIVNDEEAAKLNEIKLNVLENQMKLRKYIPEISKNIFFPENETDKKVNEVLEDMCKYGIITQKEIEKEKKINPNKFISTAEALKLENKDQGLFALGLLSKNLDDLGIETAIEKEENKENLDASTTALQFIVNGMCNKKKYDLHFDFGEKRNNELINNKVEYEKFKNNLKIKLSKDYNIPMDKIVVTFPQKGSFSIQVIFQDDKFNDLDINELKNKFKNEKVFKELCNLKEIHIDVVMKGCKLGKEQLDARGNRIEDWAIGQNRGGKPYKPPIGWIGIGLKVMDKFENNTWIGMNNSEGEWCVAYHGVGRLKKSNEVKDITRKIIVGTFNPGKGQVHELHDDILHKGKKVGNGVYCTPNIKTAESYCGTSSINGSSYQTVLMVRVKPSAIRQCECFDDYWVVNGTTDEIRPYRILYKKN